MQLAESFPAFSNPVSDVSRIFPIVILIELAGHVIASPALILLQNCLGIKPLLNLWKSVLFMHEFSEVYGHQSAIWIRAFVTPVPLNGTVTIPKQADDWFGHKHSREAGPVHADEDPDLEHGEVFLHDEECFQEAEDCKRR